MYLSLSPFIFSAGALLIHYYAERYRTKDLHDSLSEMEMDYGLPRIRSWDFIIVGAGSAGCVLAGQLSKRGFTVLLLEKGGNPVPSTYIVPLVGVASTSPEINDVYTSLPDKWTNGAVRTYIAGRMMGGTGSHNGNTYTRGSPLMYDRWANLIQDPSWKYLNMLKYHKDVQHFIGPLVNESNREAFYGSEGPLTVNTAVPPYIGLWKAAAEELGYPFEDPNTFQTESFAPVQFSMRNGLRDSSYTAFIQRHENDPRSHLTIHKYSTVESVLIRKEDKRVYGVAYKRHGMPQIAHAKKEVILSSGVMGTPAVLFRSGVGRKKALREAGIPVISDLPVGESLYSHLNIYLSFIAGNKDLANVYDPYTNVEQGLKEFQDTPRGGPYSAYARTQAFLSSTTAKGEGHNAITDLGMFVYSSRRDNPDSPTVFTGIPFLTLPRSKGHIYFNTTAYRLNNSLDSTELVKPDFATFGDPSDIEVLVEGIETTVKIFQHTRAMAPLNFTLNGSYNLYGKFDPFPEQCGKFSFGSKDYWRCFVIHQVDVAPESVGTCPMGFERDPRAVVDGKLRSQDCRRQCFTWTCQQLFQTQLSWPWRKRWFMKYLSLNI